MKFVYDDYSSNSDAVVIAFFFNSRGTVLERSTEGMYRSLLYQLFNAIPDLDSDLLLEKRYKDYEVLPQWPLTVLQTLLEVSILQLRGKKVTLFIDALDECEEDEVREMVRFFENIAESCAETEVRFRICFTSRHYPHITITRSVTVILEDQHEHDEDIKNYLATELRIGRNQHAVELQNKILSKSSGVFLWIVLAVNLLNRKHDKGRTFELETTLDAIPGKLEHLFDQILSNSDDSGYEKDFMLCIQWILYAQRPLSLHELYRAILIDLDPNFRIVENGGLVPKDEMLRLITDCSRGLLEETKSEPRYIQFIHKTVRQYFLHEMTTVQHILGPIATRAKRGHEFLKQWCVRYISLFDHDEACRILDGTDSHRRSQYMSQSGAGKLHHPNDIGTKFLRQLLAYAVTNLLPHSDAAESFGQSQDTFLDFLQQKDWRRLTKILAVAWSRPLTSEELLAVLVFRGLANLVRLQVRKVRLINIEYRFNVIVLNTAGMSKELQKTGKFQENFEATFRALLNVNQEEPDRQPLDTLVSLYQSDLEKAVQFLVNHIYQAGWRALASPLVLAVIYEQPALLRCLLATGKVDVNHSDYYLGTALIQAITYDNGEMVILLLQAGADPYAKKVNALKLALKRKQNEIVKMLLDTSITPIQPQEYYLRALKAAEAAENELGKSLVQQALEDLRFQQQSQALSV